MLVACHELHSIVVVMPDLANSFFAESLWPE